MKILPYESESTYGRTVYWTSYAGYLTICTVNVKKNLTQKDTNYTVPLHPDKIHFSRMKFIRFIERSN